MIFYFKAAQNLVVQHYERDFYMGFHFKEAQTWLQSSKKEICHAFPLFGGSKLGCRELKVDFDMIFHFNPFPPSVPVWHRLVKLSILI